ncbi:hypothetical protein [Campylobacter suis]|uniref:DUF4156 domain-containing protein n=1 Tax=Campylobacter suis TaxID=2790657 RepID=A0ABM8Q742_9BACT|nr:hypothetical protein [Campylobacter suis]CAD7288791.1 hypothetical protein LMG8286_01522 [Campylobacter suis]
MTIARSTPYNCTVLGEIGGRSDTVLGAVGANLQTLRDSAINDAKNTASQVVGANKRIMLRIFNEKAVCMQANRPVNCTEHEIGLIRSYRLNAQVFDCGEK